ncbi:hypothetical protein [Candidatus Vondammii sp. HM_W22]|uniref:hypothetical protein n=1 Tax=Candidatus Vondammii sp. HM_W22 TaxID=2687299 RepID=UPI002E7AC7FA|nr:hypothetical protein [Candidatus Vondammii sp. HM_W22]
MNAEQRNRNQRKHELKINEAYFRLCTALNQQDKANAWAGMKALVDGRSEKQVKDMEQEWQ